jgi:hypothetical protein
MGFRPYKDLPYSTVKTGGASAYVVFLLELLDGLVAPLGVTGTVSWKKLGMWIRCFDVVRLPWVAHPGGL